MSGGPLPESMRSLRIPRIDPAVGLIGAALLSIAILTWSGIRSGRAAAERRTELTRARTELSGFEDLNRRYAPAAAAESLSWRQTWSQLRMLGVYGNDRLGVTQQVSRAAEDAGLADVHVLIGPPDTTGLETRLSTEGIRRKSASFSLLVEGRGGMRSVIAFIGRLPPSVVVSRLDLVRQDGRQRHRISLAVYELEFTNGSPPNGTAGLWAPVERGTGVGGDVDGAGG